MAEKRAQLNIAHAMAHAENMERLKELEQRFRLLVEASTVGLLLIDPDGVIAMSNPAADAMFGYAEGELDGSSVDSLLPTGLRKGHAHLRAEFLKNPEVRKMGGQRELKALRKDGREFPVEVGLNPCLEHGKQFVLANIIDMSERKTAV
jgi:PAS domain S-box-containing protein